MELLTGVAEGLQPLTRRTYSTATWNPATFWCPRTGTQSLPTLSCQIEGNAATDETCTLSGAIVGTVAYMSPEQAMDAPATRAATSSLRRCAL